MSASLPDIQTQPDIGSFVDSFYTKLLADSELAPIFVDVAQIDLTVHLPLIKSYWAKLLLGDNSYSRHTMNIHRLVHSKQNFSQDNFDQWLALFELTMDEMYCGACADKAKRVAGTIVANMAKAMNR
ncbi:MAG: hemoglobin [Pseudomonadales bacterium]